MRIDITQEDDKEEQASMLVMHMLDKTKENLLKCCRSIRNYQPLIASLIEYSNDDGKSVGEYCSSLFKWKEIRRDDKDS